MEIFRHGDMETKTRRHGNIGKGRHGDMEKWRYGDMEKWDQNIREL